MGTISIQEALTNYVKGSRYKNQLNAAHIQALWGKIMGKTIEKYTDNLQLFGQCLVITTKVATLKTELHFQKEKIIERINEELGAKIVQEITVQ